MNTNFCIIPTFDELNSKQINMLNSNSYTVKYKKNETVFRQDMPISHVVFLKTGLVKVVKEENDKKIILNITSSQSFVGLLSTFCKNQYDYSATTLIDSEIVFTDITMFKNVIKDNGKFSLHIMRQISEQGLFIFDKLINLSHKQVPGRLAGMILFFSNDIFRSTIFEIPLSRQELADLISTTKESVSRTMSEFKNDRIIKLNDKSIEILSEDLLKMLVRIG